MRRHHSRTRLRKRWWESAATIPQGGATGYVELDRRFRPIEPATTAEESAFASYSETLFSFDEGLGWADLLKRRLVVVLGEPGSGKTWEFQHQADLLGARGEFSFFVRLDRLVTERFEDVLSKEQFEQFRRWGETRNSATFFLDSVDEAKFRRDSDFHTALERFRDALGSGGALRSKCILSSRISEWHPATDKQWLLRCLPRRKRLVKGAQDGNTARIQSSQSDDDSEDLLVVRLEPLDEERVAGFARSRAIADPDAFLKALDAAWAWELARRPIDVNDLISYWSANHALGSLSQLLEHNIESNLRERTGRAQTDPLTPEQARKGAEALAAATVFCRRLTFKVLDDALHVEGTLDASRCLPADWRPELARALLTRPIFDSASFGKIRFHHRRVSEYLAASWLAKRMKDGCPTRQLEQLLFTREGAERVIRPALAPIAAWLCAGDARCNEQVRAWVLERAPEIHLRYGDPGRLTIDYRRALLESLVRRAKGRSRAWLEFSVDALGRLADPSLAQVLSDHIRDHSLATDLRIALTLAVNRGRLTGCLDAILDVISREDEADELRSCCAEAVGEVGQESHRQRLARIAAHLPQLRGNLAATVCKTLYPTTISAGEFVEILAKACQTPGFHFDLPFQLRTHLESVLTPELSGELLDALLGLLQRPPTSASSPDEFPISGEFAWVVEVLPAILRILLSKARLTPAEVEQAALALRVIKTQVLPPIHSDDGDLDIHAATLPHPAVRRTCVWQSVLHCRSVRGAEPHHIHWLVGYPNNLRLGFADINWLVEDLARQRDRRDREFALRLAMDIWNQTGRSRKVRRQIVRAIQGESSLLDIYREANAAGRFAFIKRRWHRRYQYRPLTRWWWRERLGGIWMVWVWIRDQKALLLHLPLVRSGQQLNWLGILVREADEENSDSWAPHSWDDLKGKRGRLITAAAREGCKRAWRRFSPPLPHQKPKLNETDNRVIVGLAGLQAAAADGEIDWSRLPDEEAKVATRYAVNELNDFPLWLADLAKARPAPVGEVLYECIAGEWVLPATHERGGEVMRTLVWHGDGLIPLVRADLLGRLKEGDPSNLAVLNAALTLLVRLPAPPSEDLAAMARTRVHDSIAGQPGLFLWLAVWLQIDAGEAMDAFDTLIERRSDADDLMVGACAVLSGERPDRAPLLSNPSFRDPSSLRRFIPQVFKHVRLSEDIHRGESAYTPSPRDHAQDFRNTLIDALANCEFPDVEGLLRDLAEEPALAQFRELILHKVEGRRSRLANSEPWREEDVRRFAEEFEVDPKTDDDLFQILLNRLSDIRVEVETGDGGLRDQLREGDKESSLRRWLAQGLRERSRGKYTAPEEAVIDQERRPDIRIEHPTAGRVSIEVKWARRWPLSDLLERLQNQLVGHYLRAHDSRYGVYILGMIGSHTWKHPSDGRLLSFEEVVELIQSRAKQLRETIPGVHGLEVVSIDFRPRGTTSR